MEIVKLKQVQKIMWYTINILFKGEISAGSTSLYQESIYLLECITEQEAREKAIEIAHEEEHEYKNEEGHKVKWLFDSVLSIYEINSDIITSGIEIYSRFLRPSEANSLKTPFED